MSAVIVKRLTVVWKIKQDQKNDAFFHFLQWKIKDLFISQMAHKHTHTHTHHRFPPLGGMEEVNGRFET
jgi:hypothetical protein